MRHFKKQPTSQNTCIVLKIISERVSAPNFERKPGQQQVKVREEQCNNNNKKTAAPKNFSHKMSLVRHGGGYKFLFLFFFFLVSQLSYLVRKTYHFLSRQARRSRCAAVWLAYAATWCNHQERKELQTIFLSFFSEFFRAAGKISPLK